MDVAGIVKVNHDQFGQVDINGIYPMRRSSRSVGFGKVDPNQGLAVSPDEQHLEHDALPRAGRRPLTKNLTAHFQSLFTVQRQWKHLEGRGIRPTPRGSSQPDAFPEQQEHLRTDGEVDQNSLATGNSLVKQPDVESVLVRMAPRGTRRGICDVRS